MDRKKVALQIIAGLIGLRALTNVFKPLGAGSGLVFFGALLTGTANLILAPLMGIFMLIYAYGLWSGRAFALPMGIAYAAFATLNVILFPFVHGLGTVGVLPYLGFAVVGIGVPWAAVWLLAQHLRAPA